MLKIYRNRLLDSTPLFLLHFHHKQFKNVDGQPITVQMETDAGRFVDANGYTEAILRTPDGMVFNTAIAVCSASDVFNKAKGRLEALKRVTEGMSREARQTIFTAYIDSGSRLG